MLRFSIMLTGSLSGAGGPAVSSSSLGKIKSLFILFKDYDLKRKTFSTLSSHFVIDGKSSSERLIAWSKSKIC